MADLETELRSTVARHTRSVSPSPDLADRIRTRVRRRQRRRRAAAATAGAALVVAAVVGVAATNGFGDPTGDDVAIEAPRGTDTPSTTRPADRDGPEAGDPLATGPGPAPTTGSGAPTTAPEDPQPGTPPSTGGNDDGGPGTTTPDAPATTGSTAPPGPGTSAPGATAPGPTTTAGGLRPPDAEQPAAGTCGEAAGEVVTVTLNSDIPSPRCVQVAADQRLRVENATDQETTASLAAYSATLAPGTGADLGPRFGDYLQPGVHRMTTPLYGDSGPEIWLVP